MTGFSSLEIVMFFDGVKTGFSAEVEDLSSLESQDEFVNLVLHMQFVMQDSLFLKQDN